MIKFKTEYIHYAINKKILTHDNGEEKFERLCVILFILFSMKM